jgi:hypothetical protein
MSSDVRARLTLIHNGIICEGKDDVVLRDS